MIRNIAKSIPGVKATYSSLCKVRNKAIYREHSSLSAEKYPKALKRWYKQKTGETLNLENPKTINEKIQWLKLYDSTEIKTKLADKYRVREWVAEKIGEEYLIPLLGIWEKAEDIDFDTLPEKFVLKANHGCGFNIIVEDKSKINIKETRKQLNDWLKINYAFCNGFELHYKNIKPLIIAEEYIEAMDGALHDYRLLCFNNEPQYCWLDVNHFTNHRRINIYDLNWSIQPWGIHYENTESPIPKPDNFNKMIDIVRSLCQGFIHVRVDLYKVYGKIYFGEMTFTSRSGLLSIYPKEYAKKLGDMIKLPI